MEKIAASIAKVLSEAFADKSAASHELPAAVSDALDAWIADQPDPKPTRQDVIREVLTEHLKAKGYLK